MKKSIENSVAENKAKPQKAKKAVKPPKKHSHKMIGGIVGLGLALVACIELGFFLFDKYVESERMQKLSLLAQQHVDASAENLDRYLQNVWGGLARYTDRPALVSAVANGALQHQEKIKQEMERFIDGVVDIKFFKKDEVKLNDEVFPPIRFSELDLINKAADRQAVFPEAVKIDNQWLLNFVTALPGDESQDVVGTILMSLKMEQVPALVTREKISLGKVKLLQRYGEGKSRVLYEAGNGDLGILVKAKINNSNWHIEFAPSYAMKMQVSSGQLYTNLAIAGLLVLICSIATFLGCFVGGLLDKINKSKTLIEGKVTTEGKSSGDAKGAMASSIYQTKDILDVEINEEGEDLLGLDEVSETLAHQSIEEPEKEEEFSEEENARVPSEIFRAYDIRGIAKEQIDKKLAEAIGRALGSEAIDAAQEALIVARDARLSSPELTEWLIRGILSTGCNVINIGTVPTPLLYFAACTMGESQSGVMVTASHNPKEYNGFKVVINGKVRSEEDIKAIRARILRDQFYSGAGQESRLDITQKYIDTIFSDVALAGDISIVIDAANGVTGIVAPSLFEELGCRVTPLYCDLNGEFPNHSPDPSIESNLKDLIAKVQEVKADLGVAFDGDGDRLVVVTPKGRIIWPDQLLMLFAKDILSRNPGADVVFDVKSTRHLASSIANFGGRPIIWKTGHAPMKNKMLETGALVGGEYSGHIFIKERWFGFDDGMYAAARLIEIISLQSEPIDNVFDEFPCSPATPEIRVPVEESRKFDLIHDLVEKGSFEGARVIDIDGIRVEYPFGWGLIRASNTSANLTMRFEADDEDSLHKIKAILVKELRKVDPSIQVDWKAT